MLCRSIAGACAGSCFIVALSCTATILKQTESYVGLDALNLAGYVLGGHEFLVEVFDGACFRDNMKLPAVLISQSVKYCDHYFHRFA